jgi:hypothetical protein
MTDNELIAHLRDSSDLDDHSICVRYDILRWLKSKPERTRTEDKWVDILEKLNRPELDFLHAPSAYKIRHSRPCAPAWHWPQELWLLAEQMSQQCDPRGP